MNNVGIRTIIVNFDDEQLPYLSLVQGDAKTRGFDIVICDSDGKEIPPSDDYIVELVATGSNAPDKPYANRHTIKDGKYRVMIPTEALSKSGFVFLQLVFYQKSTGAVIHTIEQKCPVYRSRGQEVVESNNLYVDITALRLGLERIDELDSRYENMLGEEKIRQDAEKKRNLDEVIRKDNEAIRKADEIDRANNEDVRIDNESKRETAEADRTVIFNEMTESLEDYKTPLATDTVAGKVKIDKTEGEEAPHTVPTIGRLEEDMSAFEDRITADIQSFKDTTVSENNALKARLDKGYNEVTTQLAQTKQQIKGKINVAEYEHLVVGDDWTAAIEEAIKDCKTGGTVQFPEGTFEHTGFSVPARYLNFEGSGRYGSFLKNVSINDAITIEPSSERGSFRNIAIIGNGTGVYGQNATSGHGIVFSQNSISWNFENVTVRGHGGDGFHGGTLGHVNNVNIINSEIEFNKGSGIHFVATAGLSQINAINVRGCNIAYNGGSGFELWGNNINVSENTIQANNGYGYNISSDLVTGSGGVYCDTITIEGNYSEQNYLGLLNIKVDTGKIIGLINFEKNYATENRVAESVTSLIKISKSEEVSFFIRPLRRFNYSKNAISGIGLNVIDGGNVLHGSSEIQTDGATPLSKFVNLGYAQFITPRKIKVLNNYFDGKGLTFEQDGKSENITSNKTIMYPLKQENYKGISMFGVPLDTDYPSPRVDLVVYGRKEGSIGDYEIIQTLIAITITDGVISRNSSTISPFGENIDLYVEIKVYPGGGGGTFLYMYNPFIKFA